MGQFTCTIPSYKETININPKLIESSKTLNANDRQRNKFQMFIEKFINDLAFKNKGLSSYDLFWIIKMQDIFKIKYDDAVKNTNFTKQIDDILKSTIYNILNGLEDSAYDDNLDTKFIVDTFCSNIYVNSIRTLAQPNINIDLSSFTNTLKNAKDAVNYVTSIITDKTCKNKFKYLYELNPFDDILAKNTYTHICKPPGLFSRLFKKS